MTYRARILAAMAMVSLVPIIVLGVVVRGEMDRRMSERERTRIGALEALTRESLARESDAVRQRLRALATALAEDDRFRLATLAGSRRERSYVLDWGERAARLTGLAMLQLQDDEGRILSSGHFRDEFDRLDPELVALVRQQSGDAVLARVRTPEGPMLALARLDSLRVGGRHFTLLGGARVDSAFLARLPADSTLHVTLALDEGARVGAATPRITSSARELEALRASVDRLFLVAAGVASLAVLLASMWLATRVSGPLVALAAASAHVDLDRLDADFASDRDDEIGELTRLLGRMVRRLRASATRLREAERRAAIGDVARQVNHDLRNGLAPIRHVLRHLREVEREAPEQLPITFAERRPTLDASVAYLDALARRYASVGARGEARPCDVNAIARDLAAVMRTDDGVALELRLAPDVPRVNADPLSVRRVLENVVSNALDAVRPRGGTVRLGTERIAEQALRVVVADDGPGMSDDELTRALQDFHTTKPHGTGLGLSIVRRLTTDLGWGLRIDTAPGAGTRVTLDSPCP
jgi:signal transduction histidine kinase